MASIEYSNSPNVDTAFVVQEGGQKNRAVLTAPQDTSTLELPKNPNSTKGYVTVDGKKHKVVLTADIAGGGSGGAVSSVNGKTGDVVLTAKDVDALPQYETMPVASEDNLGEICQYSGTTDSTYTNGYFYKCVSDGATPTPAYSWERIDVQPASGGNFIPQLTELPEASADWVGKIVQYAGTDISEGGEYFRGLFYRCYTDGENYWWDICKVQSDFQNIPQFNEINRLVPDENDWMRINYYTTCDGMIFQYSGWDIDEAPITGNIISYSETISDVQLDVDMFVAYETPFTHPTDSFVQYLFDYYDGVWSVSGVSLKLSDLTDFGITYTGTPSDGDSIEVQLSSGSAAYKSGYFYQVTGDVATAKCTIAQTTGATLSDLAIDTDVLWGDDIAMTRGMYNFEYLGDSLWKAPDESTIPPIVLQDTYGITFTGTPSVGDVITVTTVVPWKQVYVYNQINVQPTLSLPDTMPTLVAADWSSSTQTISVTGVTANNIVFVSPAPSSAAEYAQCGIICTAQAADSLTFTCTATPTNDLTVNVLIM